MGSIDTEIETNRVKSGIFGQTAKFGHRPCLFHISNFGIKNKLTKQTVKTLMRRLIRSRLIWICTVCKCVSEFTWCPKLPDFTLTDVDLTVLFEPCLFHIPASSQCGEDYLRCPQTGKCIKNKYRCDGYYDCHDYSDEYNCGMYNYLLISVPMRGSTGGGGSGDLEPPSRAFLSNTCPDPLKNHKATKPAINVVPSSARQQNAI